MPSNPNPKGAAGEAAALGFLQQQGYALLDANWRCAYGELDLIMRQGKTLVFVEVKARQWRDDELNLSQAKYQRLLQAIHHYLAANRLQEADWRLDVVFVALREQPIYIEHVENAFDW